MIGADSPLDGKRVLVIEDREENLRLMRAILRLEGANILEATDGAGGIEMAEAESPDVILMDFQMPDMDGITATRTLKRNPATQPIPVIFVTAATSPEIRQGALEAGGDGFLTKPLDPMMLAGQIASIMAQRKSRV